MPRIAVRLMCAGLVAACCMVAVGCSTITPPVVLRTQSVSRSSIYWVTTVPYPVEDVRDATLKALSSMGIQTIYANKADELSGLVDGKLADEQEFEVIMRGSPPASTLISVRCGMFGNKERSLHLMDRILEKLAPTP